ncbi:MAG: ATP-dependent DNA helicase RecG [Candidatus Izemoplasmataceae bacterium]
MSLKTLSGVGPKTLEKLEALNLFSCEDIVHTYPVRYDARFLSRLSDMVDSYHYIKVKVLENAKIFAPSSKLLIITFKALVDGQTFTVKVFNQRFLLKMIKQHNTLIIFAKKQGNELLAQKVILEKSFKEAIHPIYNLSDINDNAFLKIVDQCLGLYKEKNDIIPLSLREKYKLMSKETLIAKVHTPKTLEEVIQINRRLKYEELFVYELKIQTKKYLTDAYNGLKKNVDDSFIKHFISHLPFKLHNSQNQAIQEILNDIKSTKAMHRLLQGDTGSGKTIVALISMLAIFTANFQSAFMAPTELLALQHYQTIKTHLKDFPIKIAYLSGSTKKDDRKQIIEQLKNNEIDILIGTHALFSQDVRYHKLGLVITDEQHRFGVNQRKALAFKARYPDILHLSATPIPRTLAHTLFGDMDVSTLESRKSAAERIETKLVSYADKALIKTAIYDTLKKGEQLYIVAPNIDDLEAGIKGVETVYQTIKARYKDARVGLLHSKLSPIEKSNTLKAFKDKEISILVSTTVIEVGIHIPNATLMIIYHAERFGYAQLHQLRGRVGREGKGYCLLIHDNQPSSIERLKVLETVYDGFELSEIDLQQRGFGDLIGIMQSGYLRFKHADSKEDLKILMLAKDDATEIVFDYMKDAAFKETISMAKRLINKEER